MAMMKAAPIRLIVILALGLTMPACAADDEGLVGRVVEDRMVNGDPIRVGLNSDGIIMAVHESVVSVFRSGANISEADVSGVTIDGSVASVDVTFVIGGGPTCQASATASKDDGEWRMVGLVVASCR